MKKCNKCNQEKDNIFFDKNRAQCKECRNAYHKEYKIKNKEDIDNYNKIYYENNKEQEKKRTSKYRLENLEYYSNYNKIYNPLYKVNNKNIINLNNKDRYSSDPVYRTRRLVSKSIFKSLKLSGSSKNKNSCLKYLGYSIIDLKDHLEKQFELWMNWNNQGKYNLKTWNDNDSSTWTWQIDHIIPQSKLLYTSMEDENFKKCWALSNLRPLSAKQNIVDGNRRI